MTRPPMPRRWIIRSLFLSLLILLIFAWIWSYPFRERIAYVDTSLNQVVSCESGNGAIFLGKGWGSSDSPGWIHKHLPPDPYWGEIHTLGTGFLGFRLYIFPPPHTGLGSFLLIPFWFPTLLAALLLFIAWRKTSPARPGRAFPVISTPKP